MAFLEVLGGNTADSSALSITADVRPVDPFTNTGLSFTEVVASTSVGWSGFYLTCAQTLNGVISVWTGATSAEVRIATMPVKLQLNKQVGHNMYIPIPVASGTRLSVTVSTAGTGGVNEVQVCGVPSSNFSAEPTFTAMDCGPFLLSGGSGDYADSAIIDPGATINTLGSYIELSHVGGGNDANNILNGNSLGYQYAYLGFLFNGDAVAAQENQDRLWHIARGAAASEVDEVAELYDRIESDETSLLNHVIWIPWNRASGDRLSARMQCSINTAGSRLGQVYVFGLR